MHALISKNNKKHAPFSEKLVRPELHAKGRDIKIH